MKSIGKLVSVHILILMLLFQLASKNCRNDFIHPSSYILLLVYSDLSFFFLIIIYLGSLKQKRPSEVENSVKAARTETSKQLSLDYIRLVGLSFGFLFGLGL